MNTASVNYEIETLKDKIKALTKVTRCEDVARKIVKRQELKYWNQVSIEVPGADLPMLMINEINKL